MELEINETGGYSVDYLIESMTNEEAEEMYSALDKILHKHKCKEFEDMMPSEQKRFLCDALGVPSYHDNEALRQKLETIINAI